MADINLGIYEPTSSQSKKARNLFSNTDSDMLKRLINQQIATLDGSQHTNFDSIIKKYPHLSKEVVVGLVKAGANADTPGIDKVASLDGIQSAIRAATVVKKLPSTFGNDKNLFEKARDAAYGGLKGATRVGFAALRSPYDYLTTAVRDAVALGRGEIGVQQFAQDLSPATMVTGKTTAFGALVRDVVDGGGVSTGSGFFISPESRVGKSQAKAMQEFGRINGKSFTIGRAALSGMGSDPNSDLYKVASGIIDATFNVALDPTTYLSLGTTAIGKGALKVPTLGFNKPLGVSKKGRELAELRAIAQEEKKLNNAIANIKEFPEQQRQLMKARKDELGNIKRELDNHYMNTDNAFVQAQKETNDLVNIHTEKIFKSVAEAASKTSPTLSGNNVVKFLSETIVSNKQNDTIETLSKLSADFANTGKAFPGAFVVDEIPESGKFTVGAIENTEFLVSATKKKLNVVDLSATPGQLTKAELAKEAKLRAALHERVTALINDTTIPVNTREALRPVNGSDFMDDLLSGERTITLANMIGRVKNPHAAALFTDAIEGIWKADAFSNIRSIHGSVGGIAIVNAKAVAAKEAEISKFFAESTMPGMSPDALSVVKEARETLTKAEAARAAALAEKQSLDSKVNEIQILRDYVARDSQLAQDILNNPENIRLGNLMNLEMQIGEKNFFKEYLRAEAGLVDGVGGPLTKDLSSVNEWLLGKRFAVVADIVAKQKSTSRISRLFNHKIDIEIAAKLAAEETPEGVLRVLREHLADPIADPQLARSMALRAESVAGTKIPIIKTAMPISPKMLGTVEKMERALRKQSTRSKISPLDNLDTLTTNTRIWFTAALGADGMFKNTKELDNFVDDVIDKLVSATATSTRNLNAVRSKIIHDAFKNAHKIIIDHYAPGNPELIKFVETNFKVAGKDKDLISQYVVKQLAENQQAGVMIQNGKMAVMEGAAYVHQFLDDVIAFPDTVALIKNIKRFDETKKLAGSRAALEEFNTLLGETWRTAQLAGRVSYILRNVGEMQFRQYLSGHETLLNHPFAYMAMILANPQGKALQKWLSHSAAKYEQDMMGNFFKGSDDETGKALFSEAVEEHLQFMSRSISAGDWRSADARTRMIGKIYKVVGSNDPNFHKGFATTIARFNTDDLMPLVARANSPIQERQLLDDLILNRPITIKGEVRTNVLQDIYNASVTTKNGIKGSDFDAIFLKNPELGYSPENLNKVGIRNWLFDPESSASYRTALNSLTGTGQKGIYIQQMLAVGSVELPNGVVIKIPRFKGAASVENAIEAEKKFISQLQKHFPAEDMPGAQAIFSDTKAWMDDPKNIISRFVDEFFTLAAKVENLVNFSPEYRMSYWDHVGRYAPAMNLNDLKKLQKSAVETLAPIRVKGKNGGPDRFIGKKHQTLKIIKQEIMRREKNPNIRSSMTYDVVHTTASRMAGQYTRDLFYDASKQLDTASRMRLFFPFIQAHFNTIKKWSQLGIKENPKQIYKFAKAYDALTKPGTSAIYDITDTKYNENEGFFYKDEFGTLRFRYPLVGGLFAAFAGQNMNAKDALQLTAPVQSLNLAFGSVNPGIPGVGPVVGGLYAASGKSHAFGPGWDIARDIIFPFGEPTDVADMFIPSWLNKSFLLLMNNSGLVERNVKDWAGYLASTSDYGDNPFADDTQRNKLFEDAQSMSRWTSFFGALFQNIAPATPSQEIMASIKSDNNKYNFIAMTQLYKYWDDISKNNSGDYGAAIKEFSDRFGMKNLLVILSGSTKSVTGTEDAWAFLNQNPNIASKYATRDADIVPYFFPGGEAAMSYYKWQVATGRREKLGAEKLAAAAEDLVYNMELSQIADEQATLGHSDIWYTQKVIELNKRYGSKPVSTVLTGRQEARAEAIGRALNEPAFQQSPVYKEAKQFYDAYSYAISSLQTNRNTVTPDLGSTYWLNSQYRKELTTLANQLMLQNPQFSRMYYSVFANLLTKQGA